MMIIVSHFTLTIHPFWGGGLLIFLYKVTKIGLHNYKSCLQRVKYINVVYQNSLSQNYGSSVISNKIGIICN